MSKKLPDSERGRSTCSEHLGVDKKLHGLSVGSGRYVETAHFEPGAIGVSGAIDTFSDPLGEEVELCAASHYCIGLH